MNIYFTVLKKFVQFSGRARMKEFWVFILINFIFQLVAMLLDLLLNTTISVMPFGLFYLGYSLLLFLPGLGVFVRRLHDVDKSGWLILVSLIPLVGEVWLLALCITEGTKGENKYGPDPKVVPIIVS